MRFSNEEALFIWSSDARGAKFVSVWNCRPTILSSMLILPSGKWTTVLLPLQWVWCHQSKEDISYASQVAQSDHWDSLSHPRDNYKENCNIQIVELWDETSNDQTVLMLNSIELLLLFLALLINILECRFDPPDANWGLIW